MARKLRTKGTSGVYHVLMEGTRDLEIFRDEEDYRLFLEMVKHQMEDADGEDGFSEEPYFTVYAYCLQPKCFYLLLKEEKITVSKALSRVSCAYSSYLNNKYGKSGTSYRDRFHSEPVDDAERLDVVLRHIHQVPLALEGVDSLDDYPYISVDGNGLITAHRAGEVTITAHCDDYTFNGNRLVKETTKKFQIICMETKTDHKVELVYFFPYFLENDEMIHIKNHIK